MLDELAVEVLAGVVFNAGLKVGNEGRQTLYRGSLGCTAIAVSPSIVSGRVVATIIFSSTTYQ
jgi:hypothetical protein